MSDEAEVLRPTTAKDDAAKDDAAKDDAAKDDAAKDDAAKDDAAKGDAAKDDAAKDDAAKDDAAKDDAAKDDAAKDDAAKGDAAKDASVGGGGGADRVIHLLGEVPDADAVRRKIAVFRRLEPTDIRTAGSFVVEESPYLEIVLAELRVPKKDHGELVTLFKQRREALAVSRGLMRSYDPAGWVVTCGAGGLVGVWLDYLPYALLWPLVGLTVLGALVGVGTRLAKGRAEKEADARWTASPARREHDMLAKELAASWTRAQTTLKRETGFHTVIRVAEGSVEPLRLASIDPRPYAADPPLFDPDDFLPSEDAGAVRYEQVHATGEVITRALHGTSDFREG